MGPAITKDGKRVFYLDPGAYAAERRVVVLQVIDTKSGRLLHRTILDTPVHEAEADREVGAATLWNMVESERPTPQLGEGCGRPTPQRMQLDDVAVRFAFPRLDVLRAGRLVFTRDVSAWAFRGKEDCRDANPMMLHRVFIDASANTVAMLLGYCGSDVCHEPTDRVVVMQMP